MDEILDKARATGSEEERIKLYREFQVLVMEDPPGVIPYVVNHANAYLGKVKGFKTSPMMWLDLRDATVE
jgi:peptide/nickel transport system substrate-binding protein